jgi:hypothetical protein
MFLTLRCSSRNIFLVIFPVTDNSGIRIFYTDKLREHEGSVLLLGYRHSPFLMIPPEQDNFIINGVCDPECFQKVKIIERIVL